MWLHCPQPIKLAVRNFWKFLFGLHVTSTPVWNKNLWFQADHTLDHIWFQADHTLDHIWFQADHTLDHIWFQADHCNIVRKFVWFLWCHNMVRLWSPWSGNPGMYVLCHIYNVGSTSYHVTPSTKWNCFNFELLIRCKWKQTSWLHISVVIATILLKTCVKD